MQLHQQGDKWAGMSCLELLARLAQVEHDAGRAARLFGAVEALRDAAGMPLPPAERSYYYDRVVAELRAELGEAAWAEGRAMSWEQAVAYAVADDGDSRAVGEQ